ncbi:MAG: leucine-rich repeat protein [Firmicutes bacterium]|nr:leucine-rich repeat protein [Bacillota bacterium]
MKKLLLILTIAALTTTGAFAQGGTTGPLTWNISNNTLTISGNGAMPDYYMDMPGAKAPWHDYRLAINTVVIEDGVTSIGKWAFLTHIFTSITLPNSLTTIKEAAFVACKDLTSITIPNSVTAIGWGAFDDCTTLASVTLSNTLTTIEGYAFYRTAINSITLPSSVTTIGEYAFSATALTLVVNLKPIPIGISSNVFNGVNISVCELRVPADEISRYQNADVWKNFYIVGCYLVNVTANNDEYGSVSGNNFYKANTTATVTATANSGYKFANWTKNGEIVSSANPYSFTVTEDTELVANFVDEVGIKTVESSTFKIYPNPTTGKLRIETQYTTFLHDIAVFDITGRNVGVNTLISLDNITENGIVIDISHLDAGIYFLKINNKTVKILKQ